MGVRQEVGIGEGVVSVGSRRPWIWECDDFARIGRDWGDEIFGFLEWNWWKGGVWLESEVQAIA